MLHSFSYGLVLQYGFTACSRNRNITLFSYENSKVYAKWRIRTNHQRSWCKRKAKCVYVVMVNTYPILSIKFKRRYTRCNKLIQNLLSTETNIYRIYMVQFIYIVIWTYTYRFYVWHYKNKFSTTALLLKQNTIKHYFFLSLINLSHTLSYVYFRSDFNIKNTNIYKINLINNSKVNLPLI